jgi:hypothetical protein
MVKIILVISIILLLRLALSVMLALSWVLAAIIVPGSDNFDKRDKNDDE